MTMTHIVAPVPAVHLPSAFAVSQEHGRVAFGTSAWETWQGFADREATIWIVATSTDLPATWDRSFEVGKIVLKGRFVGLEPGRNGRHPTPHLRPDTAHSGDEWTYPIFWEVGPLERVRPFSFIGLKTTSGTLLKDTPRRAIALANAPDEPT